MEELSKQVAEKAQISQHQAQIAVGEVMNFVRARLSSSLELKITEAITGEPDPTMLEKLSELTEDAQVRIGELASKTQSFLKEKFQQEKKDGEQDRKILSETYQKVEELASVAKEKINEFRAKAEKVAKEKASYVKKDEEGQEKKGNYIDDTHEKIEEIGDDVKDKLTDLAGSASSFFKSTFGKKEETKKKLETKDKKEEGK